MYARFFFKNGINNVLLNNFKNYVFLHIRVFLVFSFVQNEIFICSPCSSQYWRYANTAPFTMTKKTRSPAKQPSSPNPRPKQRNRQTSVDRFFALKPSTRAKINEAMSSNAATGSSGSDNSTNPYDALRDDEEVEEVLTDVDPNEPDEDSMSTHSARPSEPSESDYESANDSLSRVSTAKKSRLINDSALNLSATPEDVPPTFETPTPSPQATKLVPSPQTEFSVSSEGPVHKQNEFSGSKPHAQPNAKDSRQPKEDRRASENEDHLIDAPRRLFDNQNASSPMQTDVNDISPSVLDDLLYEASQYDSVLIKTSGTKPTADAHGSTAEMATVSQPDQRKQAPRPGPQFPAGGRGRGGRMQPLLPNTTYASTVHTVAAAQSSQSTQPLPRQPTVLTDTDSRMMDAQPEKKDEPDFSFTRPTYSDAIPPSPSRKNFFRCTWRVDIPKNTPPEEGLRDAILEVWSALRDADRRLLIYPWHQAAHGRYKALSDVSKFPKKKIRWFAISRTLIFALTPGQCISGYTLAAISPRKNWASKQAVFLTRRKTGRELGFGKIPFPLKTLWKSVGCSTRPRE
jgi:hypothetical protein